MSEKNDISHSEDCTKSIDHSEDCTKSINQFPKIGAGVLEFTSYDNGTRNNYYDEDRQRDRQQDRSYHDDNTDNERHIGKNSFLIKSNNKESSDRPEETKKSKILTPLKEVFHVKKTY